jgi:putative flippase GtrA
MFTKLINKYDSLTIFRFLIAGIINTIVGLSLGVFFLIVLPFHYALSIFISTFLGVCFNYFMSLKYVFRSKSSNYKIILYFSIYFLMYLVNMLFMYILINRFNMNDIISFIIVAPFIIGLTYLLQKTLIFQDEKNINNNANI